MKIRKFEAGDIPAMTEIWNGVVKAENAFPQLEPMTESAAETFFASQSFTGVAEDEDGSIAGLYILHPNNIGRCGHIANASYAVRPDLRGRRLGEALVRHSLGKGADLGFKVLQFNAVVASNTAAIHLYERLGFTRLGTVPGGYAHSDGTFEDIILFCIKLSRQQ